MSWFALQAMFVVITKRNLLRISDLFQSNGKNLFIDWSSLSGKTSLTRMLCWTPQPNKGQKESFHQLKQTEFTRHKLFSADHNFLAVANGMGIT